MSRPRSLRPSAAVSRTAVSRTAVPSAALPLAALVAAAQLVAGVAQAHIHLLEPLPRYPDAVAGENKNCPCGVGTAGRTCGIPEERSDPNRSTDRTNPLLGGSMLTVRLSEYVGHSGRFRVAFDPEGADVADFNQHILTDIADPAGKVGNTGNGTLWEISARLPNIDCKNCTLQVVQVMNGNTVDPVADTVGQSTYYQCADLELTRDPSLAEGYASPFIGPPLLPEEAPSKDPPKVVASSSADSSAPPPGNMPGSARSDTAAMTGSERLANTGSESDDSSGGGCNLGSLPRSRAWQPLALAAAALLCGSRRRRREPARSNE